MAPLTAAELARLQSVFVIWPPELIVQGLQEEVADIMAAREIAKMPPITAADAELIRQRARELGLGKQQ